MAVLQPAERHFWDAYLATLPDPHVAAAARVSAAMPGNAAIADSLVELYLAGRKTAGSGLAAEYRALGEPLPSVGDHWIVLDSNESPRCIVRTTRVELRAFSEVDAEVAAAEGEGDLSLEYWRRAHRRFFEPYAKKLGLADLDAAEVVVEFFELVYAS